MRHRPLLALRVVPLLVVVLLVSGCTSSRLHKQDFEGRSIAATAAFPPNPTIHDQYLASVGVYPHSPAGRPAMGWAETEVGQVSRLQGLLNAAIKRIDLPERVARQALVAGAERLGATITNNPDEADYVLDLRVYHYGLVMRSYNSEANFYINAELQIRNQATNEVVWKRRMDRKGSYKTQLTGAEMAHLTEAGMTRELEKFAAYAAELMTSALTKKVKNG